MYSEVLEVLVFPSHREREEDKHIDSLSLLTSAFPIALPLMVTDVKVNGVFARRDKSGKTIKKSICSKWCVCVCVCCVLCVALFEFQKFTVRVDTAHCDLVRTQCLPILP